MAITRNPVSAFIRELDKNDPNKGKSKRATLTNITGQTLGAPSGTTVLGSGKRASTSGEEKLKLAAEVENVKRRLTTNLALTPKQRQELIAEADRIAAGERRKVSVGGPTPSLFKKLQDVAYSKILSPFKSAYKTGGDFSIESQGKAWAGLVGGIINPLNRFSQSATKELSDLQLSIKNPVLREATKGAGRVLFPIQQTAANIVSMGSTKEQLLQRPDIGKDKIQPSFIDLINQASDPEYGIKKMLLWYATVSATSLLVAYKTLSPKKLLNR
jgi:hypothetical protein